MIYNYYVGKMGLGKMLGLSAKGTINVNTEKPTYYPGEVRTTVLSICLCILVLEFVDSTKHVDHLMNITTRL